MAALALPATDAAAEFASSRELLAALSALVKLAAFPSRIAFWVERETRDELTAKMDEEKASADAAKPMDCTEASEIVAALTCGLQLQNWEMQVTRGTCRSSSWLIGEKGEEGRGGGVVINAFSWEVGVDVEAEEGMEEGRASSWAASHSRCSEMNSFPFATRCERASAGVMIEGPRGTILTWRSGYSSSGFEAPDDIVEAQ
jgi:hypothetical protein